MAGIRRDVILIQILLFFCGLRAEICEHQKEIYLNSLIDCLNNLPEHQYSYEDGILLNAQEIVSNKHFITHVCEYLLKVIAETTE